MTTHFDRAYLISPASGRLRLCAPLLGVMMLCTAGCGPSRIEQLIDAAGSADLEIRHAALRELAELGPQADQASQVLVTSSTKNDADTRRLSCLALGSIYGLTEQTAHVGIPSDVRAALTGCLADKETSVRMAAAYSLLRVDSNDVEAQQTLSVGMRRGDGGVIDRIGRWQPAPVWAVPTLVEILAGDRREGNRRLAAVALGRIGASTDDVRNALKTALEDDDDRVRAAAKEAMLQIEPAQ